MCGESGQGTYRASPPPVSPIGRSLSPTPPQFSSLHGKSRGAPGVCGAEQCATRSLVY